MQKQFCEICMDWTGHTTDEHLKFELPAERSGGLQACPTSAGGSAPERADSGQRAPDVNPVPATSLACSAPVSGQAEGDKSVAVPSEDWIRMVIMVRNTERNRAIANFIPDELRRLADRFEGKKIVKGEAVSVHLFSHTKNDEPNAKPPDAGPAAGQRAQARNDRTEP